MWLSNHATSTTNKIADINESHPGDRSRVELVISTLPAQIDLDYTKYMKLLYTQVLCEDASHLLLSADMNRSTSLARTFSLTK